MPSNFFLALPIHVIIIQNALNLMKFCEFFLVANCDYFSDDFFFGSHNKLEISKTAQRKKERAKENND